MNTREVVLDILIDVEKNSKYINLDLQSFFRKNDVDSRDKAFITEILYGTVEKIYTIDYFIRRLSSIPIRKMSITVKNIIRMSLYQLLYLNKIPPSAICNEAVKLCKGRDRRNSGFVNAILRNAVRSKYELVVPEYDKKKFHSYNQYLSVRYSMPEHIVNRFVDAYGLEVTVDILTGIQSKSDMCIRCNTAKIGRNELLELLITQGFDCYKGSLSENSIYVRNALGLFETDAYRDGLFYVQDEGAMLIVEAANLNENERQSINILDMCAAPGGKTTYMAELLQDRGEIVACDNYEHKIKLINDNCHRLGLNNVTAVLKDATVYDEEYNQKFDYVFVDVPCSGSGVMGSKPEIKLNLDDATFDELPKKQYEILTNAMKYCKKGGKIVYSTCSIIPVENDDLINEFVANNSESVEVVNIDNNSLVIESRYQEKCGVTIFPHLNGTDGFYVAMLRKLS